MPRREIGAEEQEGLVRQVHRAIALEEKGRFAQAAGKFEAALKTYREAGRPRPKLQQRLDECRRKLEAETKGVVFRSSELPLGRDESDPFERARSRRATARAEEGEQAATAIQSAFRGKRDRNHLAATRSKCERTVTHRHSSADLCVAVVHSYSALLRGCSHAEYFLDSGLSSPGGADRALTERARSRVDRQKAQRLEALENEAAQLKEMLACLEVVI